MGLPSNDRFEGVEVFRPADLLFLAALLHQIDKVTERHALKLFVTEFVDQFRSNKTAVIPSEEI